MSGRKRNLKAACLAAATLIGTLVFLFRAELGKFTSSVPAGERSPVSLTIADNAQEKRWTPVARVAYLPEAIPNGEQAAGDEPDALSLRALERRGSSNDAPVGEYLFAGTVIDSYWRTPVAGALVKASCGRHQVKETQADHSGRFSLRLAARQPCQVIAWLDGYKQSQRTVDRADDDDVLIALQPYWSISGRVLDEHARPVRDARVWVRRADHHQAFNSSARTNDAGEFVIEGWIKSGPHVLGASHRAHRPTGTIELLIPDELRVRIYLETVPVDQLGSVQGRVSDSEGNPVDGARISVIDSDLMTVATTLSDASGSYGLDAIQPGTFALNCSADGFSRDATNFREIRLTGPESYDRVDFRLRRGDKMEGAVLTEVDHPVERAMVILRPADGGPGQGAFTDSEGRFGFENVPQGQHRLSVSHREFVDHQSMLSFPKDNDVTVRLSAGLTISGVIADRQGRPLPEFLLTLTPQGFEGAIRKERFDSDEGRFRLSGLTVGTYRVEVAPSAASMLQGAITLERSVFLAVLADTQDTSRPLLFVEQ